MNNKLFEEVNRIKTIMGVTTPFNLINESVEDDCEDTLKKAGYLVYSPQERKTMSEECESNPKIKCVTGFLSGAGKADSSYYVKKKRGFCYVTYKSDKISITGKSNGTDTTISIPKNVWTFFDNDDGVSGGDVSRIRTLDKVYSATTEVLGVQENINIIDSGEQIAQVQYKGKYTCTGGEISVTGMQLIGYYNFKDYRNLKESGANFFVEIGGAKYETKNLVSNNFDVSGTLLDT